MLLHAQRKIGVCLALLVLTTGAAFSRPAEQEEAEIHYTVSLADPVQHLIRVKIEVPPGTAAHDLQLPVWYALYEIRDFAQYVNRVQAKAPTGHALPVRLVDKSRWHVEGTGQGAVVEYDIFANSPEPYGAELNTEHAFFNLAEVLPYLVDERDNPVTLRFTDVPAGWRTATTLSRSASGEFSADGYDQMVDAPVEMGTFKESDFDESGGHFRVVVDADPSDYDMQKIVETDRSIVAAELEWMHDRPFNTYLFIYHVLHEPSRGGMEHANSTAIDVSARQLQQDPAYLGLVSAHEFFHIWNVKRIRPQSLEPVDYTKENYTTALWFCEGVTTTAGEYARVRAGLLDEAQFLKNLASYIQEFERRPAHLTQSAEESSLDAWFEKYPYYGLPQRSISYYTKGYLLGILLDLQMREASQGRVSLRDLFQWLDRNYAHRSRFFPDSDGVKEAAEAVSHAKYDEFFQKYVAGTEEIPWDDFFKTVGLRLEKTTSSVADLGFTVATSSGEPPSVAQVVSDSGAAKAGLSAGDVILRINGQTAGSNIQQILDHVSAEDLLRLRVRGASGEREIHWKVGTQENVEFALKDVENVTPQQKTRRAAWLRGESQPAEAKP